MGKKSWGEHGRMPGSGTNDDNTMGRTKWWEITSTHRKDPLAEDDDVHVERLEVRRAHVVLLEAAETHEIVVPEQLDLLA